MSGKIEIFNNFFSEELFKKLVEQNNKNWEARDFFHLYKDCIEDLYTKEALNEIIQFTGKNFSLKRAYSLGSCPITSNLTRHCDTYKNSSHTALLYSNPHWNSEWGSGTFFGSDNQNFVQAAPNKLILFETKDNWHHTSPSNMNVQMWRFVIVWKLHHANI